MSKKSKVVLPPVPTDPQQIKFTVNGSAYRYDTSPARCAEALGGRILGKVQCHVLVKIHNGPVLEIAWEVQ
jgi:hypothetical protein